MKILVYGAGNIGGLYAGLLRESGHDVSILARGERLVDIRDNGVRLEDSVSGRQTTTHVEGIERVDPTVHYDLGLVTLPKNRISEVLPILAADVRTSSVMFFSNNAAGPQEMIEALGRDRVLLGFPGAAAVTDGRRLRYLILSPREQPTTIGELDGSRSPRIEAIGRALEAAGFPVAISSNMDAWLKTHVVEIVPTLCALYMAGGDPHRLARSREPLRLMLSAIREGYRVLRAQDVPVTPAMHRLFEWLPKPILLTLARRMLESEETAIKIGHAEGARAEMKLVADELRSLAGQTSVPVPALGRLCAYL